ncbi:hypothetical protein PLESTB_001134300 [Pleodorina starrii]|uniref:CCHC-type domain-containing protein n=1 Tax=Pleodorina starrii TaxID=330485 RepID=A0A9W6F4Y2_9CHLO|nr:hypothetical protein PLESTB_001134300 [Pleodorina starrii]GLC69070.1 hypothetical protein PLESTF_000776200 [Pleodorina starrii]
MGLAHFTPAQRQYALALLPQGRAASYPQGAAAAAPLQPAFAAPPPPGYGPPRYEPPRLPAAPPPPPVNVPGALPRAPMRPCFSCNQLGHEWKHCPRYLAKANTPEGIAEYHAFRHMGVQQTAAARRAPAPPQ